MGSIGKATEPCQQTTEWLLTSDFWLFLEPWHARWYEYEICIASCTDSIYIWLRKWEMIGDMIGHVGIYGSRVAEGLSASNVGLVRRYWGSGLVWIRYFSCASQSPNHPPPCWSRDTWPNAICISLISWHRDCAGNWNHSPAWLGDRNLMLPLLVLQPDILWYFVSIQSLLIPWPLASATMVWNMQVLAFHKEGFQLSALSRHREIIQNVNIFFYPMLGADWLSIG